MGAQPPGEGQSARGQRGLDVEDLPDLLEGKIPRRRSRTDGDDEAGLDLRSERSPDARPRRGPAGGLIGDEIMERLVEGQGKDDLGEEGHVSARRAMTFLMSSQTIFLRERLPSLRTR